MKKIRVLIADDEPLAQQGLAVLLARDPEIEVIATCGEGASALATIRSERPDLVFLDVQMPQLGGLELYEKLAPSERPAVVFVTAYSDYAVQAFEMSAVDYLLKPFRDARFKAALDRAKEQIRRANYSEVQHHVKELLAHLRRIEGTAESPPRETGPGPGSRLVFKVSGEHVFIEPAELAWIEAQGEFVKLRTGNLTHLVREPLHAVEKRLDPAVFVRIHRSFIVNVAYIRKITPTLYGDHDVLTSDGAKIRMSRTYRDKLKQLLAAPAR